MAASAGSISPAVSRCTVADGSSTTLPTMAYATGAHSSLPGSTSFWSTVAVGSVTLWPSTSPSFSATFSRSAAERVGVLPPESPSLSLPPESEHAASRVRDRAATPATQDRRMTALLNSRSFFGISFDERLVGVTLLHVTGIGARNSALTRAGYGREHHGRPERCTGHE